MEPSVGRTVHLHVEGVSQPLCAFITRVIDGPRGVVDLWVPPVRTAEPVPGGVFHECWDIPQKADGSSAPLQWDWPVLQSAG